MCATGLAVAHTLTMKKLATSALAASAAVLVASPTHAESVPITYTVTADTPNVQVAFSPGQWQQYTLNYSNMEGRYLLSIPTTPMEVPADMFIAVRGSKYQSCRIRIAGVVRVVDQSRSVATCRA